MYDGMCYRLLAFWDKEHNSLIIVTHGFVKKTWKVPQKELDKVEPFMSELVDEVWGEIGTPERDEMEVRLKEELNAYFVGEAIKKARQAQNLTQEELGRRIGVQRAQISKLENGKSVITLPTMSRVFRALGIKSGVLELGTLGKVALW